MIEPTDQFLVSQDGQISPNRHDSDAYQIYVIGDSIAWGNDLNRINKYYYIIAQQLREKLQGSVELTVYAHSGAVITGSIGCIAKKGNDGLAGTGCPQPTLMDQAKNIPKNADLVLVSGGINDVGIGNMANDKISVGEIKSHTAEKIIEPMTNLVEKILEKNSYVKVVVTGYFPVVTESSKLTPADKAAMTAVAVQQDPYGEAKNFMAKEVNTKLQVDLLPEKPVVSSPEANFEAFYIESTKSIDAAVTTANNGGNRAVFVDPKFQPTQAVCTDDALLFPVRIPNGISSIGHPNERGASKYAERIMEEIANKINEDPKWLSQSSTSQYKTVVAPVIPGLQGHDSSVVGKWLITGIEVDGNAFKYYLEFYSDGTYSGSCRYAETQSLQASIISGSNGLGCETGDWTQVGNNVYAKIQNSQTTYELTISGDSMTGFDIYPNGISRSISGERIMSPVHVSNEVLEMILHDDFNSYSSGDLNGQEGWATSDGTAGNIKVQGTMVKEGAKAVGGERFIDNENVKKSGKALRDGAATFYILNDDSIKKTPSFILMQGSTICFGVGIHGTGAEKVDYVDSTDNWVNFAEYTTNTWFYVQMEWRSSDCKVRYSCNGGPWTDWVEPLHAWTTGVDTVRIGVQSGGSTYFDCISIVRKC
jgi:lysophospholipase L1-like esterase